MPPPSLSDGRARFRVIRRSWLAELTEERRDEAIRAHDHSTLTSGRVRSRDRRRVRLHAGRATTSAQRNGILERPHRAWQLQFRGYLTNWIWGIFTAVHDVRDYNANLRRAATGAGPPAGPSRVVPRPVPPPSGESWRIRIQLSRGGAWHQADLLPDGRVRVRGELRVGAGDVIWLQTPDHEAPVRYVVLSKVTENPDPWTAYTYLTLGDG